MFAYKVEKGEASSRSKAKPARIKMMAAKAGPEKALKIL
jgi:hypothetical protein